MKRSLIVLGCALALVPVVVAVGCGSSDSGGDNGPAGGGALGPGQYRGLLTSSTESGVIDVTVPGSGGASTQSKHGLDTADEKALTGSLVVTGGAPIALTGSYDPDLGTVSLSGGGYSLNGTVANGGFSGTYTGPNGGGSFTVASNAGGTTQVLCGSVSGQGANGPLNMLVTGSSAIGFVLPDGKSVAHITCSISGTTMTCSVQEDPNVAVTGTLNGDTWTGTAINSSKGEQASWTASPCSGSTPDGDGGTTCNTIANVGAVVNETTDPGALPTMTGGSLVDGTYVMTSHVEYGTTSTSTGTHKATFQVSGGNVQLVVSDNGAPDSHVDLTLTLSGNQYSFASTCPAGWNESGTFTATPTTWATVKTGSSTVVTFTKQ